MTGRDPRQHGSGHTGGWLGFRGGMGVGTSCGAFFPVHPWTIPLAVLAFAIRYFCDTLLLGITIGGA